MKCGGVFIVITFLFIYSRYFFGFLCISLSLGPFLTLTLHTHFCVTLALDKPVIRLAVRTERRINEIFHFLLKHFSLHFVIPRIAIPVGLDFFICFGLFSLFIPLSLALSLSFHFGESRETQLHYTWPQLCKRKSDCYATEKIGMPIQKLNKYIKRMCMHRTYKMFCANLICIWFICREITDIARTAEKN